MKVHELITELQKRHPDAQVEVFFHPAHGATMPLHQDESYTYQNEYELYRIASVGDWGDPGSADDLVTVNASELVGC